MSNDSHMSSVKRCPTAIFLHLGRRFLCTPSALALASTCASSSQSFANNKLLLQWQFHPQSQSQSESQRSEHFSRFGYTSVSVLRFSACVREPGHGRYITACALFFVQSWSMLDHVLILKESLSISISISIQGKKAAKNKNKVLAAGCLD